MYQEINFLRHFTFLWSKAMVLQLAPVSFSVESEVQNSIPANWTPVCHITYNRDSWVKLNQSPSEYSDSEALLLCEKTSGVWISWVAGYGEIILDKSEFYC